MKNNQMSKILNSISGDLEIINALDFTIEILSVTLKAVICVIVIYEY